LHQLCQPLLAHAERLPQPQHLALRTAFGLSSAPPPDLFLVALAGLGLLSDAGEERPLVCLVDDAQWLDKASAQALGVIARRLVADRVGLVFAAREPGPDLARLAELEVDGLRERDARALLESALPAPLDAHVRDLLVAETRGNPLALLELPRGLTPTEFAGGFGVAGRPSLTGRIEESFARQMDALPAETQRLLQLAAADPSGDGLLVRRAAKRLGIQLQSAAVAGVEAGFVEIGTQVRFRHPLARSVAYRSAQTSERQELHAALADVTDPRVDPDRRAWHRAAAAALPDDEVATELERSAGRAQARGGLAAAAAFLERAFLLTVDPARGTERALKAAQASLRAGAFGKTEELLAALEAAGPLDEHASARVDLLRGQVAFSSGLGADAPPLLLKAAKRLEPLDLDLARETYLSAWIAALFAGNLAGAGDMVEVSRAARALPAPGEPARTVDLVLDGLTQIVVDGPTSAAPVLKRAVSAFVNEEITAEEAIRWGWQAQAAASALWDDDSWYSVLLRQARFARDFGALDELPMTLASLGTAVAWSGDFDEAEALISEVDSICEVTGTRAAPFTAMLLASWRGRQAEALPLIEATVAGALTSGQGVAVAYAHWAKAILDNGLGQYPEALRAAGRAAEDTCALHISMWALPELVEAAVRTGETHLAATTVDRLAQFTRAGGTDFGLGMLARASALVSDSRIAEGLYHEAIERLGRTRLRPELARAHLLYGEWLRLQERRVDSRTELRVAYDLFADMGAAAFAERARRELAATGETARNQARHTVSELTRQEMQIARLAVDGKTNSEIGTQLYLSPRTVEWHLRKVFGKLDISSRRELGRALRMTRSGQGPR
jgi:DNA-binding CsgD family transcriptional regulator